MEGQIPIAGRPQGCNICSDEPLRQRVNSMFLAPLSERKIQKCLGLSAYRIKKHRDYCLSPDFLAHVDETRKAFREREKIVCGLKADPEADARSRALVARKEAANLLTLVGVAGNTVESLRLEIPISEVGRKTLADLFGEAFASMFVRDRADILEQFDSLVREGEVTRIAQEDAKKRKWLSKRNRQLNCEMRIYKRARKVRMLSREEQDWSYV